MTEQNIVIITKVLRIVILLFMLYMVNRLYSRDVETMSQRYGSLRRRIRRWVEGR